MRREPYKYRVRLSGKEKQILRQAKKKGRQSARLVMRNYLSTKSGEPGL